MKSITLAVCQRRIANNERRRRRQAAISSGRRHRHDRTVAGNGSMACSEHNPHSLLYRGGKTTNSFADSNNKRCHASNARERRHAQAVRLALDPRREPPGLPHLKLEGAAKPQGRRWPRPPAPASMSSSPAHLRDPRVQISLDQLPGQVADKTPVIDMCATERGLADAGNRQNGAPAEADGLVVYSASGACQRGQASSASLLSSAGSVIPFKTSSPSF
jgi:hypothetical protein